MDQNIIKLKTYRRRQWIINPKFQWYMVVTTLSMILVVTAIFMVANEAVFKSLHQSGLEAGIELNHPYYSMVTQIHHQSLVMSGIACIFVLGLVFIWSVIVSNRIAGPIYRLEQYLQKYGTQKNHGNFVIRKSDHFQDLATAVNTCLNPKGESYDRTSSK